MWIYQEGSGTERQAVCPAKENVLPFSEALPEIKTPAAGQSSEAKVGIPAALSKGRRAKVTDCWLLAAAFLLGSAMSGILLAMSAAQRTEWLEHYLHAWLALFSGTATELFIWEYLTLSGTATILLLFGFSAFGPVLTFFFFMVYGTGSGLLAAQLITGTGGKEKLLLTFFSSVPACAAAALLCVLGSAALRVSGKIRAYSFQQGRAELHRPESRAFASQYMLTLLLLLPLCGAAAGLSCLESRLL